MARLTIQNLINSMEEAAENLLNAAGDDGVVSKNDIREKLATQREPFRTLLEAFYDFLRDENQPHMRVTRAVINDGIQHVKDKIIPLFEITPAGLSDEEQRAMLELGAETLALGTALKRAGRGNTYLPSKIIFQQIAENTQELFFDYIGSEGSKPIEAVLIDANVKQLTPESFSEALQLKPNDPAQVVERFVSAEPFFTTFICQHYNFELDHKATIIANLMRENLTQNTVVVLGRDNDPNVGPLHPAYVVGVADNGDLVGFRSQVVWT